MSTLLFCPECLRRIEAMPNLRRNGDEVMQWHRNDVGAVCLGSALTVCETIQRQLKTTENDNDTRKTEPTTTHDRQGSEVSG